MSRGVYISMLLIAVVAWVLSASLKIWLVFEHGFSINDTLIDPSIMFPVILVPIWLAELIKFATAEREKNVLDPHFVVHAGEPAIVRPFRALLCVLFVALGGLGLWGQGPFAALRSPLLLVALIVFGVLGATIVFGVIRLPRGDGANPEIWYFTVFFAAFAVFTPIALQWQNVTLIVSPAGLDYSLFKVGPIAWSDIRQATLVRVLIFNQFIVLDVPNPEKYLGQGTHDRKPRRFRNRFSSPFVIPAATIDVSVDWLLEVIRARIEPSVNEPTAMQGDLRSPIEIPSA